MEATYGRPELSIVGLLPSEILLDILCRLAPIDVAAFAQTCRTANELVSASAQLWSVLYHRHWDSTADCAPSTSATPQSRHYVQARTRARNNLRRGIKDQRRLLTSHSETLKALVRAARDRLPRDPQLLTTTPNADLPASRTSASLAAFFPPNRVGDLRWASFVYPREGLTALKQWQMDTRSEKQIKLNEERERLAKRNSAKSKGKGKSKEQPAEDGQPDDSALQSARPRANGTKRLKLVESGEGSAAQTSGSSADLTVNSSKGKSASQGTRRSTRLQLAQVPESLRDFLGERWQPGIDPPLEDIFVDEESAAQLHVLHGVRMMSMPSAADKLAAAEKKMRKSKRGQADRSRGERKDKQRSQQIADLDADDVMSGYESVDGLDANQIAEMRSPGMFPSDDDHGRSVSSPINILSGPLMDSDDESDDDWEAPEEDAGSDIEANNQDAINSLMQDHLGAGGETDGEDDDDGGVIGAEFTLMTPSRDLINSYLGAREGRDGDPKLRRQAKEYVYDSGRYAWENMWGPFKPYRMWVELREGAMGDYKDVMRIEPPFGVADTEESMATDEPGDAEGDSSMSSDDSSGLGDEVQAVLGSADISESDNGSSVEDDGDGDDDEGDGNNDSESDMDSDSDNTPDPDAFFNHPPGARSRNFGRMVSELSAYSGCRVRDETYRQIHEVGFDQVEKEATEDESQPGIGIWTRPVNVDWVLLERIMVVVHANLHDAVHLSSWGDGFEIPPHARGDSGDGGLGYVDACEHQRQGRLLYRQTGWDISRGQKYVSPEQLQKSAPDETGDNDDAMTAEAKEQESSTAEKTDTNADDSIPQDWANIESATWLGTYFYLDFPIFLQYNSKLARQGTPQSEDGSWHRLPTGDTRFLDGNEATGDCLQLRLKLEPRRRSGDLTRDWNDFDLKEAKHLGADDPQYPTLRFSGQTFTSAENELSAPEARASTHGFARPIYSDEPDRQKARYYAAEDKWLPEIVGVQWCITHAYEGLDRWALSGCQPGPPGTRAPIYGTWSDVTRDEASPVGPFVYFNVDSRPWQSLEEWRVRRANLVREVQRDAA